MTRPWTALFIFAGLVVSGRASLAATQPDPQKGDDTARPRPDWVQQGADWRLPGGARVRALHRPAHAPVLTHETARPVRPAVHQKKIEPDQAVMLQNGSATSASGEVSVYTINNPPMDGFVPWLAVHATHKVSTFDWQTYFSDYVQGWYYVANPETTYGIGLFDTGAGVSVIGNEVGTQLGLFANGLDSVNTISIGGVTGSVDAWVSYPFGLWITGLGSISPSGTLNLNDMMGEYNASVALGQTPDPGQPDLFTAIGSPMAVFMSTSIRNDVRRRVVWNGDAYEGPDITFYQAESQELPVYSNTLPLDLRPAGGAVYWWPCMEGLGCTGDQDAPQYPSLILGDKMQSLFFVGSVNLSDRGLAANGRTKFILDTGAQVTVVSSLVGAQLGLNPKTPDFTVEIQGVDGNTYYKPGFYLDTVDLPALGDWLSFTHVPVVLIDMASPEGGLLDGIIGMNLFMRYNIVLHGGAFSQYTPPRIDFEPLASIDADYDNDGDVDMTDFAHLQTCLSGEDVPQPLDACQDAFLDGDDDVDTNDLLLFMQCAKGAGIPAGPECLGL